MPTTLPALIVSARSLVGDSATANYLPAENMNNPDVGNTVNAVNVNFNLVNFPISAVVSVNADNNLLATTAYSVTANTGAMILACAPGESLRSAYYFNFFSDADWIEFITWGLERMNMSTNVPSVDVPNVQDGLLSALKTYACAAFANRMSLQTGTWYNQRLQEQIEDRDAISKKYADMAKELTKDGDNQLDNLYKGAGQQFKPAFQILSRPPRPYTPAR